jgi:hypothetical protein
MKNKFSIELVLINFWTNNFQKPLSKPDYIKIIEYLASVSQHVIDVTSNETRVQQGSNNMSLLRLAMKQGSNETRAQWGNNKERRKKQQSKGVRKGPTKQESNEKKECQKKKTKKHDGVKQKLGPVHIQEPKKEHEASSSHYRWAMTPPKA